MYEIVTFDGGYDVVTIVEGRDAMGRPDTGSEPVAAYVVESVDTGHVYVVPAKRILEATDVNILR